MKTIEEMYPVKSLFPVWQYINREAARCRGCAKHSLNQDELYSELLEASNILASHAIYVERMISNNLEEAIVKLDELLCKKH